MLRLLYTLSCQGEFNWPRHAGSLPVRQKAHERHEIVLEGVIGRRRAPTMPHVSLNSHGDNGARGSCACHESMGGWRNDALELRGQFTEGVFILSRNRNDCVFLSPNDPIPEYNFIPDL